MVCCVTDQAGFAFEHTLILACRNC